MKMQNNKIKLPQQSMRAAFEPETFNEEEMTIDIIWTTGAQVKRYDWLNGQYIEELSMKKADIRMERLNLGAPFLKNHSSRSLEDTIGVVRKAWVKEGKGHATIKLSSNDDARGIVQNVRDGILKNISVGYRIHRLEDVSKKKDEIPTYRATDWEPMELSLVNIPADPEAQVRSESDDNETNDVILIRNEEIEMTKKKTAKKAAKKVEKKEVEIEVRKENQEELNNSLDQNEENQDNEKEEIRSEEVVEENQPAVDESTETEIETLDERGADEEIKVDLRKIEKERGIEIRKAVKAARLEPVLAEEMIENDLTIENARALIITKLSERSENIKTKNHNVEVRDVEKKLQVREAATRSILHRADSTIELKDGDRQFMGGSLLDTAREVLASEGVDVRGLNGIELSKRALHSSSDFGAILENVSNKSLRQAYDEAPQTFSPFTRETSAKDFKEISRVQLGEGTGLEKVLEGGEYKRGTLSEASEKYKVEKYGKILGFTWELLVNDDLDAFARVPAILGRKARAKESELIYKIINDNAAMNDGIALYHANHGNLGTAAIIGEGSVSEARKLFRTQTGLDGEILNLKPKYLYVPTALETVSQKFLTSVLATKESDVNIFSQSLIPIVEPALDAAFGGSDTAWYIMGDKGMLDIVELARLNGEGPQMFTREGFDVDGMETKIRYTFGVKAIDHRGMFKNAGA